MRLVLLPILSALAFAPALFAEEGDAEASLRAARAALKNVGTAHYQASHTVRDGDGTDVEPPIRGEVWLQRLEGKGLLPFRMAVAGEVTARGGDEPMAFHQTFDGIHARSRNAVEKTVFEAKLESKTAGLLNPGIALVRPDVLDGQLMDFALDNGEFAFGAEAAVGGTACKVIEARLSVPGSPLSRVRFAIGAEDELLRRVELIFDDGARKLTQTLELENLETGMEIAAERFAPPAPEGFAVETFESSEPELIAAGAEAPDFTLKDAAGEEHSLSGYRGKIVVLDFWATWCRPCKVAMPDVQKLHERFAGKPVVVLGVNTFEEDPADAAAYMKDEGYTYGLLVNGDKVATRYGVTGIPTFYVIGADGKVLLAESGFEKGGMDKIAVLIEENLPGT